MLEVEDSTVVSPGAVRVTFASGARGFEWVTPSDASFTNGTPRDRGDGKDGYQWLSFSRSLANPGESPGGEIPSSQASMFLTVSP
jgi:hypothetical protein